MRSKPHVKSGVGIVSPRRCSFARQSHALRISGTRARDWKETVVMPLSTMLFSFTGRLNRAPYWLAAIAASVVAALIVFVIVLAIGRIIPATIVLVVAVFLPLIWITLALAIKRLHDRDKSGWWLLLFYLAPSILEVIGKSAGLAMSIVGPIGMGIGIWGLVEIGFLRGTAGQNSYGPDPLAGPGSI